MQHRLKHSLIYAIYKLPTAAPKPRAEGSSPSAPAIRASLNFLLLKVDLRLAFFVFKKA